MHNTTCIPDSYFSTPEFLHIASHIATAIGTPIHLFGAWVILFRTPPSMSSVKWPLLNLHFWSTLLDTSVCLLSTPFLLFPSIAGYTMGVLTNWHTPTWLQFHMLITFVGLLIVAMMTVYENRYFMVSFLSKTGVWIKLRHWFLIIVYLVGSTFLIPFTATIPDQGRAVDMVYQVIISKSLSPTLYQRLPCLSLPRQLVFVYTFNLSLAFFVLAVLLLACFLIIITFIILTIRNLLKNTRTGWQSQKTLKLQKRFLFGLVVQTTIPVIAVFCPILYMGYSIVEYYYNQAYNNFTVIIFSTHGILSTIAMLLIHQPYREATWNILTSFPKRNTARVISLHTEQKI